MDTLELGPIKIRNKLAIRAFAFIDDRLGVKEILTDEVFEKIVPAHLTFWACFGGITFFIFITPVMSHGYPILPLTAVFKNVKLRHRLFL